MKHPIHGLPGWNRVSRDSVGSTNAEAMDWFRSGDPGQLWITAQRQTAGKGRRGRQWHSPDGNLHASLLLVDPAPLEATATLPLVAAIALHDAISASVEGVDGRLKIKWPNDLLLDGGKVAGILLEAVTDATGRRAVIVGFGVNCNATPETGLYPTATLSGGRVPVLIDSVFDALVVSCAGNLTIWSEGRGFGEIRKRWLAQAMGQGQKLVARFADREVSGIFRDLDANGYLIIKLPDGTKERISAADIFLENSSQQCA